MNKKKQSRTERFKLSGEVSFNGTNKMVAHISHNGKAWGRIEMSNGSLTWVPKHKRFGITFNWKQFASKLEA